MQEQNFEKQVQQKMEEFSLTPSVPVWQKVEKEIHQKKKRRRVIFFWLFPFVLLGAGLLIWNKTPLSDKMEQVSLTAPSPSTLSATPSDSELPTTKITKHTETTGSIKTTIKPANEGVSITNNSNKKLAYEIVVRTTDLSLTPKTSSKLISLKNNTESTNEIAEAEFAQKDTKAKIAIQDDKDIEASNPVQHAATATRSDSVLQSLLVEDAGAITTVDTKDPKTAVSNEKQQEQKVNESFTDSLLVINKEGKKKAKWHFATQAAVGISSLQSDLLTEISSAPEVRSQFSSSNGIPISPTAALATPSSIEKRLGYQLALVAKRSLSKRIMGSIGLQYSQFTTSIKIGKSVARDTVITIAGSDKSINGYYQTGPNAQLQNYKNKYHFLELPVAMEWRPLKNLPLHVQAGTHLSYLVASNALVYDSRARIYYHNKDIFNRLQVHFNTGFTYQLLKSKQWSLHAGPYLQYGITNLQKDKVSNNYHLFATGLKTQFSF